LCGEGLLAGPPGNEGYTAEGEEGLAEAHKNLLGDSPMAKAGAGVKDGEGLGGGFREPSLEGQGEAGFTKTQAIVFPKGEAQGVEEVQALEDFSAAVFAWGHGDVGQGFGHAASGAYDGGMGGHPAGQQAGADRGCAPIGTINDGVPAVFSELGNVPREGPQAQAMCMEGNQLRNKGVAFQDASGFGVDEDVGLGIGGQGFQEGGEQQSLPHAVVHAHQQDFGDAAEVLGAKAALGAPKQGGGEVAGEVFGPKLGPFAHRLHKNEV